jgi:hypothetical protein
VLTTAPAIERRPHAHRWVVRRRNPSRDLPAEDSAIDCLPSAPNSRLDRVRRELTDTILFQSRMTTSSPLILRSSERLVRWRSPAHCLISEHGKPLTACLSHSDVSNVFVSPAVRLVLKSQRAPRNPVVVFRTAMRTMFPVVDDHEFAVVLQQRRPRRGSLLSGLPTARTPAAARPLEIAVGLMTTRVHPGPPPCWTPNNACRKCARREDEVCRRAAARAARAQLSVLQNVIDG